MATQPVDGAQETDAFDTAFASYAAGDTPPDAAATPPVDDTPAVPAAAPEVPADGEPAPSAPPAGGSAGDPPAAPEAPATPPAEPPAPPAKSEPAPPAPPAAVSADDIVAKLADALNRPQEQTEAETPEAPLYTAEDQSAIDNYTKNWPDVAKAEALIRRAEYHDMLKFVFTQVRDFVAPLQDQVRTIGNGMHMGELKAAVPDYSENLEAEVSSWVDSQPSYLQKGMREVMQTGTSEEVADLIGRYKADMGVAPPAPAAQAPAAAAPPAPPAKTELSSAAKQAAESLAPVSGERTQAPAGEDPDDFDSAFARYAASDKPM